MFRVSRKLAKLRYALLMILHLNSILVLKTFLLSRISPGIRCRIFLSYAESRWQTRYYPRSFQSPDVHTFASLHKNLALLSQCTYP
jgi:hypothetical protein